MTCHFHARARFALADAGYEVLLTTKRQNAANKRAAAMVARYDEIVLLGDLAAPGQHDRRTFRMRRRHGIRA